jgi:modulator of FtsH protease HflC
MNRIKLVVILAVLGIVTFVAMSSIYTVSEVEQAIITQFGEPIGAPVTAAGLKVKVPFIQDVNLIDKRVLEWDGNPTDMPTKDKLYISTSSPAGGLQILSNTFCACTMNAVLSPAWTIF